MAIHDVTELEVYKKSLRILDKVYALVSTVPRQHRDVVGQIIRSAESIAPLITEGWAKRDSIKELKRFLRMAMGSSDESITHLRKIYLLYKRYNSIDKDLCISIGEEFKIISKMLNKMITSWKDFRK